MAEFEIKEKYDMNDYRRLIAVLRAPGGCPWDAEQTHESIRRSLLEEAYELAHAIDSGDKANLLEELGDVLMQVIFHAQIEEEQGTFDLDDVSDAACRKLIFRHSYLFGDEAAVENAASALDVWDRQKRVEKQQKTVTETMVSVPENMPALWRAEKIQKKAAAANFDWPDKSFAMRKLREETDELAAGIAAGVADNIEEEVGDVLLSAVEVARFEGIDPERALHRACEKFLRRFAYVEAECAKQGKITEELSLCELEAFYQDARHSLEGKEKQYFL